MPNVPLLVADLPQVPDLRVQIEVREERTVTRFKAPDGRECLGMGLLNQTSIVGRYAETTRVFNKFKTTIKDSRGANLGAAQALVALHSAGRLLLKDAVGIDMLPNFQRFLYSVREAIPVRRPLVVCLEVSPYILPIEIWPLWDLMPQPLPADASEADLVRFIAQISGAFLGFECVVMYEFAVRPNPIVGALWQGNHLPVQKFHFAGLRESEKELAIFQPPHFESNQPPWPSQSTDTEDAFHALLWDRSRSYRIHHFCCHYKSERERDESLLSLSWNRQPHCDITIASLEERFIGFSLDPAMKRKVGCPAPLVFLNACGTSKIDPLSVGTLPLMLIEFGYAGVIGTYCNVPDKTALRFAEIFYARLVQGTPLGVAILEARRELLFSDHNPLGILYTSYVDPGLHVTPEESVAAWPRKRRHPRRSPNAR